MGSAASKPVKDSVKDTVLSEHLEQDSTLPMNDRVFACLMEPKHIAQVCQIEQICFASPWSAQSFQNELEKNPLCRYFVLLDKAQPAQVVAYGGYWKIVDEGHITNVAVRPQWQGQGAGTYLMQQMMAFAFAEGIQAMTLEVRRSNVIAQALYQKLGFVTEGVRKQYYEDNKEDALLMWYRQANGEEQN